MPSQLSPAEIEKAAKALKATGGKTISPLDYRFLVPELLGYVSHDALHRYSLTAMRAYVDTLKMYKEIPEDAADIVIAAYTPEKVPCKKADAIEENITKHDVRAKVRAAQSAIPRSMRGWAYLAPTSFDLLDTAKAAALRDAGMEVILPDAIKYERALIKRFAEIEENGPLVMMGRTHKQHAACTTFGHVVGEWLGGFHPAVEEFHRSIGMLRGKFSGFVGTRAAQKLLFEMNPKSISGNVMLHMGLTEDPLTGQVVHQTYFFPYFSNLVLMSANIAKFAEDIRNYSQTEVGEIVEGKLSTAVGSSTGAHKANPINSENIGGQWRSIDADIVSVYNDIITDFQRDLRSSANSRFYVPEIPAKATYAIRRATALAEKFNVRRSKIAENIGLTRGQVIAEPLQLYLQKWTAAQGRFVDAHDYVRKLSNKALDSGKTLQEIASEDRLIAKMFKEIPKEKVEIILDPVKYIGEADRDARVFLKHLERDLISIEAAIEEHKLKITYI